jgi:hypothetical protein
VAAEGGTRGGDGTPIEPFNLQVPPPSPNGHQKRRRRRGALRGVPAGLLVTGALATSILPRLHLLNLAFFEPWRRPVVVSGFGGIAAGASRRGRPWAAALVGAATAVAGLWIVYGMTRAQNRVLFVERDPVRVIVSDLARLAAYAAPAGGLGAVTGWWARRVVVRTRKRREKPITKLRGF